MNPGITPNKKVLNEEKAEECTNLEIKEKLSILEIKEKLSTLEKNIQQLSKERSSLEWKQKNLEERRSRQENRGSELEKLSEDLNRIKKRTPVDYVLPQYGSNHTTHFICVKDSCLGLPLIFVKMNTANIADLSAFCFAVRKIFNINGYVFPLMGNKSLFRYDGQTSVLYRIDELIPKIQCLDEAESVEQEITKFAQGILKSSICVDPYTIFVKNPHSLSLISIAWYSYLKEQIENLQEFFCSAFSSISKEFMVKHFILSCGELLLISEPDAILKDEEYLRRDMGQVLLKEKKFKYEQEKLNKELNGGERPKSKTSKKGQRSKI